MTSSWRSDRIGAALRGENPTVIRRLATGFAVIGDAQFLPGYCVFVSDDPTENRLADLPRRRRLAFWADVDLLGAAVHEVCAARDPAFRRVNYEVQGNYDPVLHCHIWPRYEWEGERAMHQVARHPMERWSDPHTALGPEHDELREKIGVALDRLG